MKIPEILNAQQFLDGAKVVSFDTETHDPNLKTTGPSVRTGGYICGIALKTDTGKFHYLDYGHPGPKKYNPREVYDFTKQVMESPIAKLGVNILYDMDYFAEIGINVHGKLYDIQVAEPLINEEKRGQYGLDALGKFYLNKGKDETKLEDFCNDMGWKGKPQQHMAKLTAGMVEPYAYSDVDMPLEIFRKQWRIMKDEELLKVFDIEMRLVPFLLSMRRRGVRVDSNKVEQAIITFEVKLKELHKKLNYISGYEVNYNAAASIYKAYDNLGIPYPLTPKTKKPSFKADWLEAEGSDLSKLILECRQTEKFLNTFLKNSLTDFQVNGRIHTLFHQLKSDDTGTVTGRFSSTMPNLQQIPKRNEILGPMIRQMFIPEEGSLWTKSDYSQIELVLMMHFARGRGAEDFRVAYTEATEKYKETGNSKDKLDLHQWCANVANIDRTPAKTISLGSMYCMGKAKMAYKLKMSIEEADRILKTYHSRLPFIRATTNHCSAIMERRGYVKTILGRRRRIADSNFSYKAFNAVDQGSAADLMKVAMVYCWEEGLYNNTGLEPHLTVHDELDDSIAPTSEAIDAYKRQLEIMETAIEFNVPILVDGEIGKNWGNVEDFNRKASNEEILKAWQ